MILDRPFEGESVIKPIGEIAQAIEAMSFADWALFVVEISKKMEKTVDNPLVIGEND